LNLGASAQPAAAAVPAGSQLQTAFVRAALQVIANTRTWANGLPRRRAASITRKFRNAASAVVATRAEAQALEDEGVRIMALPFPELETLQ